MSENIIDIKKISQDIIDLFKKYDSLLIYINGSPDPDVIASSFAIKELANIYNCKITIYSKKNVSLNQNSFLIKKIGIPIKFDKQKPNMINFKGYIVLDFQSCYVEEISNELKCVLHIDHHTKDGDKIQPELQIISPEVGSVSTIIALLLKELKPQIKQPIFNRIATALFYGITSDTDDLKHSFPIDVEAIDFLKPSIIQTIIDYIKKTPHNEETRKIVNNALLNHILYKDWFICGVGYLNEKHRDSIAIAGDYILQLEQDKNVVIFCIVEKDDYEGLYIDASFRTNNLALDLNNFIKSITHNGGGRKNKGAYQVNLDYFSKYADKELLWKIVSDTTISYMKNEIDNISSFKWSLSSVFNKFSNFFKKKQ